MPELFTNFARTTLAADISDIDTTLTVAVGNGALFASPSGGDYTSISLLSADLLRKEKVLCTARSGDVLTITRGADPAYPAKSFPAGSIVLSDATAETLTRYESFLTTALETVGARVYSTSNISLPDSTPTALTFDAERFDTHGFHSTVTNPDRLTVPAGKGGTYLIFAGAQFAANATGFRELAIDVNGVPIVAPLQQAATGAFIITILSLTTVYQLVPGDVVRCLATQGSGGSLNVDAAGNYSPEFGLMRIGT